MITEIKRFIVDIIDPQQKKQEECYVLIKPLANIIKQKINFKADPTSYSNINQNLNKPKHEKFVTSRLRGLDDFEFLSTGYPILKFKDNIEEEILDEIKSVPCLARSFQRINYSKTKLKLDSLSKFILSQKLICFKSGSYGKGLTDVDVFRYITTEIGFTFDIDGFGTHAFYKLPCGGIRGYSVDMSLYCNNIRIFQMDEEL
jgi:hypothetical protein